MQSTERCYKSKLKIMNLEIAIFLATPFIGLIIFSGICDYVNKRINNLETNRKQENEK